MADDFHFQDGRCFRCRGGSFTLSDCIGGSSHFGEGVHALVVAEGVSARVVLGIVVLVALSYDSLTSRRWRGVLLGLGCVLGLRAARGKPCPWVKFLLRRQCLHDVLRVVRTVFADRLLR